MTSKISLKKAPALRDHRGICNYLCICPCPAFGEIMQAKSGAKFVFDAIQERGTKSNINPAAAKKNERPLW